jgi:hypothetical protein
MIWILPLIQWKNSTRHSDEASGAETSQSGWSVLNPKNLEIMKRLTIIKKFPVIELEQAILKSDQSFGLTTYARSEFTRKQKMLLRAVETPLMLCDDGSLWYLTTDRILHKFSWLGMLHNGLAAVVKIHDDHILIGEYQYDREKLRESGYNWTISS